MAFKIPDFTAVGFDDPRATGGLPNYPKTDPGAEGLAALGKGVQAAGVAVLGIADDRQKKRDQVNSAFASADLDANLFRTSEALKHERDPAKIDELKAQIPGFVVSAGAVITDPEARQMWALKHNEKIVKAEGVANDQHRKIYNDSFLAGADKQLTEQARLAAQASDPAMREQAKANIGNIIGSLRSAGVIGAAKEQELMSGFGEKVIIGTVNWLDANKDPIGAGRFLRENLRHIDPDKAESLSRHLRPMEDREVVKRWRSGGPGAGGDAVERFLDMTEKHESGGRNIQQQVVGPNGGYNPSVGRVTGPSSAQGYFQIINPTWREFAPQAGVDIDKYPNAMSAPYDVQRKVARTIATTGGVQHWTDYNKNLKAAVSAAGMPVSGPITGGAAEVPPAAATAAPEAAGKPVAIGDSIAAHLIRKTDGAVAGVEYNDVYKDDSTAVSGASPAVVLGTINKTPEGNIKGRDILLSTGASYNPGQIDMVADQIKALKARGARSVTVLGVGTADRVKGANDQLSTIAAENGAAFAGPLRKVAGDGIDSSDPKDLLAQTQAVRPTVGAGAAAAAQPAPATQPGVPDIRTEAARIKAAKDRGELTGEQADIAYREAQQDQQQAMLGHERAESNLTLAVAKGEKGSADIEDEWRAGHISDAKRTQLQLHIIEEQKKQAIRNQMILRTVSAGAGGAPLDPKSKDDRTGLNLHYDAVSSTWAAELQAKRAIDPEAVDDTLDRQIAYSAKYGMVPTALQARIRGGLHSVRPDLAIESARTVNRLRNANPQLVGELDDENDLRLATLISTYDSAGMAPEEAVRRSVEGLKVSKADREARAEDFDAQRGKTAVERHKADTTWIEKQQNSWDVRDPIVDPMMRSEFDAISKAEFERTGNIEASRRMALDTINQVWGRSRVGGGLRYMKDAPEKFYGVSTLSEGENAAWMNEQLGADMAKSALRDPDNPITPDRTRLLPDPTRAQAGRPVYQVWLAKPDGSWQQVIKPDGNPIAWKPDWLSSDGYKRQQIEKQRNIDVARGLRSPIPAAEKLQDTDAGRMLEEVR